MRWKTSSPQRRGRQTRRRTTVPERVLRHRSRVGTSLPETKKAIRDNGLVPLVQCEGDGEAAVLLFRDSLFFKACDALIEVAHRLFERGNRAHQGTEGDFQIVEIGAHQVEEIGHRLEAGVNFVVERDGRSPRHRGGVSDGPRSNSRLDRGRLSFGPEPHASAHYSERMRLKCPPSR
jgi:hypothetical protein